MTSTQASSRGEGGKPIMDTYRVRALAFLALALCFVSSGKAGQPGSQGPKLLLRVVNRHFTVGKRIPSDFLKVFSDGTVECHAVDDEAVVKRKQLSPKELAEVASVLNDDGLRHLGHDYKLFRWVVDSWMEWNVTIEQPSYERSVTIAFHGASDRTVLPDALRKLNCVILELRRKAYGDDTTYYAPACNGG